LVQHFLFELYVGELCFRRSEFHFFIMNGDLVFSVFVRLVLCTLGFVGAQYTKRRKRNTDSRPQKGAFKAQSQAIYHYMNHDGFNYSRPNWSGADIGPRYSLSTLTIGNTYVGLLIYRDSIYSLYLLKVHYPISHSTIFKLKY
jgi:hypothetical protein